MIPLQVVSASVHHEQEDSKAYAPDTFDTIIVDEAHHSCSQTYRKILDYFKPRRVDRFYRQHPIGVMAWGWKLFLTRLFSSVICDSVSRTNFSPEYSEK